MNRPHCAFCGDEVQQPVGAINRAIKISAPLYCDRSCASMGRRKNKTIAQKREEKRLYDLVYRARNIDRIKARKKAAFQRDYNPIEAAIYRKKRMHLHVEYCRQPKYRLYRSAYDRKRRAAEYGSFAEAYLLSIDLNKEIKQRSSTYEIKLENSTLGKAQKRKRNHDSTTLCFGA